MSRKAFTLNFRHLRNRVSQETGPTGKTPLRFVGQFVDFWAGINWSIRTKILLSLAVVILLMGSTNIILVWQVLNYSRQYDVFINNITTANSISGSSKNSIKNLIDNEMWKIVAGKISFEVGTQYTYIDEINKKLYEIMANTDSQRAKVKLDVVLRGMQTIKEYVDKIGTQKASQSTTAMNEAVLEDIRLATSTAEEDLQNYVVFEAARTRDQYDKMRSSFVRWEIFSIGLIVGAVGFSLLAAWGLSRSIYTPIKKLHDVTTTITKNDLQALMTSDNVDEITELGMSFNIMIGKIRELLDSKIKEQQNLKKAELRALQAQINPHFLYNTLDTIIWMAEAKKNDQVIEIVSALSSFFRISLSKGRDWITIGEEIERTRSYLTIQKMRYRDILDYEIQVDANVTNYTILKLILQPLVENALYHGIKNKRQGGTIIIRARPKNENEVQLEVQDNGIGFTPEKLAQLQEELEDESGDIKLESGFGIGNVNKRIWLYYGKPYGLTVQSEYHTGTCVTLVIPAIQGDREEEKVP